MNLLSGDNSPSMIQFHGGSVDKIMPLFESMDEMVGWAIILPCFHFSVRIDLAAVGDIPE